MIDVWVFGLHQANTRRIIVCSESRHGNPAVDKEI